MSQKSSKVRSVALIMTGLMLGALTIAPAFANHTPAHTKKQVKKLGKQVKQLKNKVATLPTTSAVQTAIDATFDGNIKRFRASANEGGPDVTIGTWGPFTLVLRCYDDGAPGGSFSSDLILKTSENNSIMTSDDDDEADFDTGEEPLVGGGTSDLVTDPQDYWDEEDEFSASAPSGKAIRGETSTWTNYMGKNCVVEGYVMTII